MANEISILNARDFIRKGGVCGNFIATTYSVVGDRVIIEADCNVCGIKNRIPWANVSAEVRTPGTLPCVNRERHPAAAKPAAPNWQTMSDEEFRLFVHRLPSDKYLSIARKDPAFAARDSEMPNKYIDRKEAIARKDAADKEARIAPFRELYTRLYFACMNNCARPVANLDAFIRLSDTEREKIITQFDLRNNDYRVI